MLTGHLHLLEDALKGPTTEVLLLGFRFAPSWFPYWFRFMLAPGIFQLTVHSMMLHGEFSPKRFSLLGGLGAPKYLRDT